MPFIRYIFRNFAVCSCLLQTKISFVRYYFNVENPKKISVEKMISYQTQKSVEPV